MKTLTKAAISAAAVMAITTGTLALTASAAVNASQYDLPKSSYSANTKIKSVTDNAKNILEYSVTNEVDGERIYCVNSNEDRITTNKVVNGIESNLTVIRDGYKGRYKWCGVCLYDNDDKIYSMISLKYQNNPNAESVKAVVSGTTNKVIKKGFYVFSINEGDESLDPTLSQVDLTVNLIY